MKNVLFAICFFINVFSQNVDFSDTLKFPLGTTSFKTFYEQHVGFILEEKDGEKSLTSKLSKKNIVKYLFDKDENFTGIIFLLTEFDEDLKLSTLNKLKKKLGKGIEKNSFGGEGNKWEFGKYEIRSGFVTMAKFWTLILTLKEN